MESKHAQSTQMISQGVENLITRLKQDGVQAGQEEAQKIIKDAQDKANKICNEAQATTKKMIEEAHHFIQQEKKAAEDALQLAARNMRLELRQNLIDRFAQEVKRIIHRELDNESMLRQLILVIAAESVEQLHAFKAKHIEIELPKKVLDFEEIKKNPDLMKTDPLKSLVQSVTRQMLKEGMHVKITTTDQFSAGVKVHLQDEEIVLDLTEEAVSHLLIKHMQPRFRALLEGLLQ